MEVYLKTRIIYIYIFNFDLLAMGSSNKSKLIEKAKVSIHKDLFENSLINILSSEEEGYKEFIDCIN